MMLFSLLNVNLQMSSGQAGNALEQKEQAEAYTAIENRSTDRASRNDAAHSKPPFQAKTSSNLPAKP